MLRARVHNPPRPAVVCRACRGYGQALCPACLAGGPASATGRARVLVEIDHDSERRGRARAPPDGGGKTASAGASLTVASAAASLSKVKTSGAASTLPASPSSAGRVAGLGQGQGLPVSGKGGGSRLSRVVRDDLPPIESLLEDLADFGPSSSAAGGGRGGRGGRDGGRGEHSPRLTAAGAPDLRFRAGQTRPPEQRAKIRATMLGRNKGTKWPQEVRETIAAGMRVAFETTDLRHRISLGKTGAPMHCRLCGEVGHNRRTCTAAAPLAAADSFTADARGSTETSDASLIRGSDGDPAARPAARPTEVSGEG